MRAPKLRWWMRLGIFLVAVILLAGAFFWIEHQLAVTAEGLVPASGSYVTNGTVDITWKLAHYRPGSGRVTLSVDGRAIPESEISLTEEGPRTRLQLADGTHCLTAGFTSRNIFARNVTGSSVITVVTRPPSVQVLSPSPATALRGRTVPFLARSDRVVVSAQLTVDGQTVPVTLTGETISAKLSPGLGIHQLALTVTDQAGSTTTERWEATADLHNPAADALVPPEVQAVSAILIDEDDGRVIASKNPDAERAMASTTKIMTALLAIEMLPLDKEVTASAEASSVGERALGLKPGDRLTVEQLLYGTLVRSGNDAAFALAEAAAGTEAAFVARMNQKAEELGLTHTRYANPHGLDAAGAHSSAADLAKLARVAMQNEVFRRIVGTKGYSILLPSADEPFAFTTGNQLLKGLDWVTGIKTGSTSQAGFCLVGSGTRNDYSVISVVLGESSWEATWEDSKALMEFGFEWKTVDARPVVQSALAPVRTVTVAEPSTWVGTFPAPYEPRGEIDVVTKQGLELALAEGASVQQRVILPPMLSPPVAEGQVLGRQEFTVGGKPVAWVDLVAAQAVEKLSVWDRIGRGWHTAIEFLKRQF